jgi:hypothetical protein
MARKNDSQHLKDCKSLRLPCISVVSSPIHLPGLPSFHFPERHLVVAGLRVENGGWLSSRREYVWNRSVSSGG